jgi:hypothetical protein
MIWPLTRRQWLWSLALGVVTLTALVLALTTGHPVGAGAVLAWPVAFRLAPFTRIDKDNES